MYIIDPSHSSIGFVVRHAMVTKVRGTFDEFEGTINREEPSASVTVKTASINTGNADRDGHVRNEDFFDVEKFPEMTFVTTGFDIDEIGNGTVTGDLTIKGITKSIELKVQDAAEFEDRFGFEATGTINRKDFGVDFTAPLKTGGLMLSEDIKLEIEVSAVKQ